MESVVGLQGVMQPAADVMAGDTFSVNDFVVTASGTEVTGPAGVAGFLPVHMPLFQPSVLQGRIDSVFQIAHVSRGFVDETMAGGKLSVGGDPKVSGPGSAGVGAMGGFSDFFEGVDHVEEGVALALEDMGFEAESTLDHCFEELLEVGGCHFTLAVAGFEQGRETDAVESEGDEFVEERDEAHVFRSDGDARGDLHFLLAIEERTNPFKDALVAALSVLHRTQSVVGFTDPIQADRDREAVFFEEIHILGLDQGAVGGEGEGELEFVLLSEARSVSGGFHQVKAIGEGFTAHESEVDPFSWLLVLQEQVNGLLGGFEGHGGLRSAKGPLLGIAVGAGHVALLGDGER